MEEKNGRVIGMRIAAEITGIEETRQRVERLRQLLADVDKEIDALNACEITATVTTGNKPTNRTWYLCDPAKAVECKKTSCVHNPNAPFADIGCNRTSKKEWAVLDEDGKLIVCEPASDKRD